MTADAVPPHPDPLAGVMETVRRLLAPGGCAWHAEQHHESLVRYLIEETSEFIDAVERGLPADEVAAELGDVLYQVLLHAAIAGRDGEGYDLASVAEALDRKLIARHPHVFGERGYLSAEQLHAEWEGLKEDAAGQARGARGALDGIPVGMPTLARAAKVVERLRRAGLIDAAAAARAAERASREVPLDEDRIGDAMLALVLRANGADVDPDRALRRAVERLAERAGRSS